MANVDKAKLVYKKFPFHSATHLASIPNKLVLEVDY